MRDRIIHAAKEKVIQHGWKKFTIGDIASELGICNKTVYNYFENKNEIISAVVDIYVKQEEISILKALESEGNWTDKLQALISSFSTENPPLVTEELQRFYPQEWIKLEAMRERGRVYLEELLIKARESGQIKSDISPSVIKLAFIVVREVLGNTSNLAYMKLTYRQALSGFKKIIFEGILTNKVQYKSQELDNLSPGKSKILRENKINDTRTRVTQVAREKINQYGFRKLTIDDITIELGISKKTFYKYFTSKNEIISAVVDMNVELEKAGVLKALELEGSWTDKLQRLMFTFVPERPVWVTKEIERFFPQEWVKIQAMRRWRKPIMDEVLIKAVKNGEIRSDISPEIVLLTMGSIFLVLVDPNNLKWIDMTYNQAIVEFNKIIYTGILIEKKLF